MECKITNCKYYEEGNCSLINPTLEVTNLMPLTSAKVVVCANFEHKLI